MILKPIFILLSTMAIGSSLSAAPVRIIFDTDMGNDIDDAMALAMIHHLERRGACELLAVTSTKDHPKSAAYIDALNTYYGVPDIPIGAVRNGMTPKLGKYIGFADDKLPNGKLRYPHDLTSGEDAPEAVALLRKTLAAQPDKSVVLVQVGFFTNLARLLDSKPDASSPMKGTELIRKKVKSLVIMAGAFETIWFNTRWLEYNVKIDVPSAQKLASEWPTEIIWTGFEIGIAATYPWQSIMEDYEYEEKHLIKESYLAYVPEHPHDRPTWDLTAVLYAVYPDRDYFGLSPTGTVQVQDDGATLFKPDDKGRDRYLTLTDTQTARVVEAFVQLVSEPPPSYRPKK
jgi:inosine-uridine nucleoside N-ribohydrolase